MDATPVAVDINTIKKYITKEDLKKLNLKWGFSKTKKQYIGFKVTVVLDKDILTPVLIRIDTGAPHNSIIYEKILKKLKRIRLLGKRTLFYFHRGYYSQKTIK